MDREKCAVCDGKLKSIYCRHAYPACISPPCGDFSDDVFMDYIFGSCDTCGCVQMMKLVDPAILYGNNHNITYNTPTWSAHHTAFTAFIKRNDVGRSIIEIGGNPNILAPRFKDTKYRIMDICDQSATNGDIEYINANCENYEYDVMSDLILSHVFEHLYNPRVFVENLAKYKVPKVLISIPNMDELLKENCKFILNPEHTYFINKVLMDFLFEKNGYKLKQNEAFGNHSCFYCYEYSNEPNPTLKLPNINIESKFLEILEKPDASHTLPNIKYDFIAPAGVYGQYIYNVLKPDICGFLDNDVSKHNRRVYGTNAFTFGFDKLKEYVGKDINILLGARLYNKELTEQLMSYSDKIHIYYV